MKKLIALTAITALLALTGCTKTPDAEPVEAVAENTTTKPAKTKTAKKPTEKKAEDSRYTLKDVNGTVYTLDLDPEPTSETKAADEAIAKAMAFEADTDPADLKNITEWASLTIDNTNSEVESGASYVDIKVVGDGNQYGIITDPSGYVAELTWMSEYGDQAEADEYNNMLDVADALTKDEVVKPGVKITYPVVIETGLPTKVDKVWCWDQEMK